MPTTTTVLSLVDALRQQALLPPAQLDVASRELAQRFPEPRALAKELLQRGWLTPYQVNQLLQGQSDKLVLGPYLMLERLGEGGMGQVFKARHRLMDRVVALKVIRKDRLGNALTMDRFLREIKAAAALADPNIVMAYDAVQLGDTLLLSMEYVEGTDLARLVKQRGPLPVAEACEYVRQTALGLQHAYERGLVHRDIKPANLLLASGPGSAGTVKILDLGLARLAKPGDPDDTSLLTQEGAVVGTPDYLAPEQTINPSKVDIRADLYSLGCTLYFLLTGRVPFLGQTLGEKLMKHNLEQAAPVEQLRPETPARVAAIVKKLMAKKPEDRYQTPAELLAALAATGLVAETRIQPGRPAAPLAIPVASTGGPAPAAIPLSTSPSLAERLQSWLAALPAVLQRQLAEPRRRRWLLLAGGGLAAVVFLVTLFQLLPTAGRPGPLQFIQANTAQQSILATLKANGYPTLEDGWHYIGPFDNANGAGYFLSYPPEKEIDFSKTYKGKNDQPASWMPLPNFQVGNVVNLARFRDNEHSCVYLYHEIQAIEDMELPVSLGYNETLTLWLNGERLLSENVPHDAAPDQAQAVLKLKRGVNPLLVKVCSSRYTWQFYIMPKFPAALEEAFGHRLRIEFLRDALEFENLKILAKSGDFAAGPQDMRRHVQSAWSKQAQLQVQATQQGDWIDMEITVPANERYRIYAYVSKGPEFGIIQFSIQDRPLGERIDCYQPGPVVNTGPIDLGQVALQRGPNKLRVEVVGADHRSTGQRYGFAIDCILLRR